VASRTVQDEIESLVPEVLQQLRTAEGENLVSFVLFGSVARGEARLGSDVDLLLVLRELPPERFTRFLIFDRALGPLRGRLRTLAAAGVAFDWSPLILTIAEARTLRPLYFDLTDEARILHDVGGFFAGVLAEVAGRLRALGARRVRLADGSLYWDLKPDYQPGEVFEL
jgi:hypothetical protein